MADAADSKSADRKVVKVRLLSPAPTNRTDFPQVCFTIDDRQERSESNTRGMKVSLVWHFDRNSIRRIYLKGLAFFTRIVYITI